MESTDPVTVGLVGSRCVVCGEAHLPPRDPCPSCWSGVEPLALSPHVVLETYTVVYCGPKDSEVPYALGAFREGVRAFARIVTEDFQGLRVGQRLSVLTDGDGEVSAYLFSASDGG